MTVALSRRPSLYACALLLAACSVPAPVVQAPITIVVPAPSPCPDTERVLVDDALDLLSVDGGADAP